jgi:hypothetical protein
LGLYHSPSDIYSVRRDKGEDKKRQALLMIYYTLVLLSFISKTNFGFGQKMNSVSDDPKFFFKHFFSFGSFKKSRHLNIGDGFQSTR